MILRSLEVQNFRAVHRAHLSFGRGLNVLFGPNDYGKSSLLEALRAAFLLPVGSSETRAFIPWGTDLLPTVIVEFDAKGDSWKITKTFGSGPRGTAILEQLGKSGALHEVARGRDVEGKLREILAWGVPPPGGRGAPRGQPESYLTVALLGFQDKVSSILEASLDDDRTDTGRRLVTEALGALGQDPLVSRLLERLEEQVSRAFTPTGQFRRAQDSPLAEVSRKIEAVKAREKMAVERVRESEEIELRVQGLTEQKGLAREECSRLQRKFELLRSVREKEEELELIRANEKSVEETRQALADKEEARDRIVSVLRKAELELRSESERLLKAEGSYEIVCANTQQTLSSRRAQLIAERETAIQRAKSATEVIQARELTQTCQGELAQAEGNYIRTQQAEARAQNLARLTSLLAEWKHASEMIQAAKIAQTDRDDRAALAAQLKGKLNGAEAALEEAERTLSLKESLLAAAQREAAMRDIRKDTLNSSLIRVAHLEAEAVQAIARINAVSECSERLSVAERSLADREAVEEEVESKLAENAVRKQDCESREPPTMPMPLSAGVLAALLMGGAAFSVFGIELKFQGLVLLTAIVGCGILGGGLVLAFLRHRRLRETNKIRHDEIAQLVREREDLLERRNRVSAERGVAQIRVESFRSERDRAMAVAMVVGDPLDYLKAAELRLQKARGEAEQIREDLAALDCQQPQHGLIPTSKVEEAEQAVLILKEQITETRRKLDEARHQLAESTVRLEAATSSNSAVDLADLERRVTVARSEACYDVPPDPEQAQEIARLAVQNVSNAETAMRVATTRLSDARVRYEALVATLGQPADQILVESEIKREATDRELESLEERASADEAVAEKQFLEARASVVVIEEQLKEIQALADAATSARDDVRTKHNEALNRLESLKGSTPNASIRDLESALSQASLEYETCSGELAYIPEDLTAVSELLEQQQSDSRRIENELHSARGQLELVGGAVAKEHLDRLREELEELQNIAAEMELDYRASKRLLDVLREAEARHAAHLGCCLAKPVAERLLELNTGRYRQVVLDPSLRVRSIAAGGGDREPASLSVGTRDQLATLIRLALAAYLKTILVLDDQLSHSDQLRLAWFRDHLRASVRDYDHQIIIITCRPLDYLRPEEIPQRVCDGLETDEGRLTVLNIERCTERR
jgi:DNA repair exonuclease SbcCD ATPase subunit